jgi:hypothetical protein
MIERRLKMTASNPTPPPGGTARTGWEVRKVFDAALADAWKEAEARGVALSPGETPATVEKVAAAFRLELVAGSAGSLWLRAGTEEWRLDNPPDATQAFVRAAFCCPGKVLAFRHQGDVITELVLQGTNLRRPKDVSRT